LIRRAVSRARVRGVNLLFWKERHSHRKSKDAVLAKEIPRDDDRRGPAPPPPRTAHAPGVSVYRFDAIPSRNLLRLDGGDGGFFLEGEKGRGGAAALLILTGGGGALPGDVLVWSPSLPLEELSRTTPEPHHHIRRDDLGGRAVSGITGLRALYRGEGFTILRLGPPPGARWVFKGIHAVAVFSGRLAAFDGDDVKEIRAGSLARVADPTATLYLEAGNDAALAVALAASGFVAALG
jgi:hypothetical protein